MGASERTQQGHGAKVGCVLTVFQPEEFLSATMRVAPRRQQGDQKGGVISVAMRSSLDDDREDTPCGNIQGRNR